MKQSSESAELSVSSWDRTYECLNCWTEEKYHEFNTLNVLKTRLVLLGILCLHSSNRRGPETLCFCTVRPCVCVRARPCIPDRLTVDFQFCITVHLPLLSSSHFHRLVSPSSTLSVPVPSWLVAPTITLFSGQFVDDTFL